MFSQQIGIKWALLPRLCAKNSAKALRPLVSLSRRVRLLSGEAAMMQWNPLEIEGQPDLSALGQGGEGPAVG